MQVKFTSKRKQVIAELDKKMDLICEVIGRTAEAYAKEDTPVDTGRLRNSIAHEHEKTNPDSWAVMIGSNVEYAPYVEFMDMAHEVGKAHFLRDAVTTHNDQYKKAAENILKS